MSINSNDIQRLAEDYNVDSDVVQQVADMLSVTEGVDTLEQYLDQCILVI